VLKGGSANGFPGPNTGLSLGNGPFLTTTFSFLSSERRPRDLQFLSAAPLCGKKRWVPQVSLLRPGIPATCPQWKPNPLTNWQRVYEPTAHRSSGNVFMRVESPNFNCGPRDRVLTLESSVNHRQ